MEESIDEKIARFNAKFAHLEEPSAPPVSPTRVAPKKAPISSAPPSEAVTRLLDRLVYRFDLAAKPDAKWQEYAERALSGRSTERVLRAVDWAARHSFWGTTIRRAGFPVAMFATKIDVLLNQMLEDGALKPEPKVHPNKQKGYDVENKVDCDVDTEVGWWGSGPFEIDLSEEDIGL